MKMKPSNRDPGPWKEVSCENGMRIVETADFPSFFQFVNAGFGDYDCEHLWRGQRCGSWEITSALARTGKNESQHLHYFRDAIARCTNIEYDISNNNTRRDEEMLKLWALGQHHGLATPLIDWTIYPFVALFFAFAEQPQTEDSDFRSVFALLSKRVRYINFDISETKGVGPFREKLENPPYSEEFKKYLVENFGVRGDEGTLMVHESNIPPHIKERLCKAEHERHKKRELHMHHSLANENRRIHAQGGWHIFTPENVPVESWIRANHENHEAILTKILIPTSERKAVLTGLNKMNVNYLSLFPDFEGAARHANMGLHEGEWVSGVRIY